MSPDENKKIQKRFGANRHWTEDLAEQVLHTLLEEHALGWLAFPTFMSPDHSAR